MSIKTSRAYSLNEETGNYEITYPLTHMNAVYTKDDESETLGNKLADIDNAIDDNTNKLGALTGLETNYKDDLVGAINENVASLSDIANCEIFIESYFPKQIGDTSDSERIQRAIDYLYNKYGTKQVGKIRFANKIYEIDKTIDLRNNGTQIIGSGSRPNGTVFKAIASVDSIFSSAVSCNHGLGFAQFYINGNDLANCGIIASTGETSYIRDVLCEHCIESSIQVNGGVPLLIENLSVFHSKYGVNIVESSGHTITMVNLSGDNNDNLIRIVGSASLHVEILGMKSESSYDSGYVYHQNDIILLDNCGGIKLGIHGATCLANASTYPTGTTPNLSSLVCIKNISSPSYLPSITLDNIYMESDYEYYIDDQVNSIQVKRNDYNRGDLITYDKTIINAGNYKTGIVANNIYCKNLYENNYSKARVMLDSNTTVIYVDGTNGNDANNGLNSANAVKTIAEALKIVPTPLANNITINISNLDGTESVYLNKLKSNRESTLNLNFNGNYVEYLDFHYCECNIIINNVNVKNTSLKSQDIVISNCSKNITINGYSGISSVSYGVYVANAEKVIINGCSISNKGSMILAWSNSCVSVINLAGTGNTNGLRAYELSRIMATGSTYTATTSSTTASGGTVVTY